MRLLHVYSGNLYGGIETILVTLARTRAEASDGSRLSHEFALCFEGRLAEELRTLGAPVHRLREVRTSRPASARRARRALDDLLAAQSFDRVVCHAPWSQAIFGSLVRRAHRPLVFWAHDAIAGRHWTERWARRTPPDLAICNSRYTAGTLPALYRRVQTRVVYAPVDVTRTPMSAADRRAVRASFGTSQTATVIIQVSRSDPGKGHGELVRALSLLRDLPDWVWWQVGGAQRPAESAYLEDIKRHVVDAGIADRVRFLGERADVRMLLASADIHCQANVKAEAFGLAFVEALAAGLPVVTSAIGGALEIVDDSCGMLLPAGDVAQLSTALRSLLTDAARRSRLGAAGPARARALCDPAAQSRRLADVLCSIPPHAHVQSADVEEPRRAVSAIESLPIGLVRR